MWEQGGYVSGLEGFRLILLDHRGHGRSGKPTDLEAHRVERYVDDVIAVLDNLDIERAAFWGYSGGATVGYALAASHPNRIAGLVLQGSIGDGDYDRSEEQEPTRATAEEARRRGLAAMIKDGEAAEGMTFPDWFLQQMASTDGEMFALEILGSALWYGPWSVLEDIHCPVLMLVGEREDPEGDNPRAASRMANARCVTFPGLGHIGAYVRSDLALAEAVPFLRRIANAPSP
jgi:pimeloyl-ACP methyl ester carboxylesterase